MRKLIRKIYMSHQVNLYVLFLVGRVGSTYLNSLLNSHLYIHAMGEKSLEFRDEEATNQLRIVRRLLTPPLIGKYKAIGFNVKLAHIKDLDGFNRIIQHKGCKILHLKRNNRIKAVISFLNGRRLAEATGMWGLFKESDRLPPFTIDLEEFDVALKRREKLDFELEQYISQLRSSKMILSYEDMLKDQDVFLNKIFSFLEVEPRPVQGETLKITSDDLRDVVLNFDDLRAKYQHTQYAEMFDEVIA